MRTSHPQSSESGHTAASFLFQQLYAPSVLGHALRALLRSILFQAAPIWCRLGLSLTRAEPSSTGSVQV
eukprot:6177334-Pleurochrysis_carterae.AAC.1